MKKDRIVILISGKQRAGKNDAAYLINRGLNYTFKPSPFALPIKEIYAAKMGLHIEDVELLKNTRPEVRKALIDISRKYKEQNLYHWVDKALEKEGNLIIPDLRYQYELERCQELVDMVLTVRVDASRETRALRGVLSNEQDQSETDLDAYNWWDYAIDNNYSRKSLEQQCDIVVDSINTLIRQQKAPK